MYTGPGAGPMIAASAAWDALADDLYSVRHRLRVRDHGPDIDMAGSFFYIDGRVRPLPTCRGSALSPRRPAETAAQAKAAVAAYEAAFAMTVPPTVIAANRALLLALVATNFFGQNTPAIMATEAEYVEMWAQDAVAMYGYAGASSAASTVAPFTAPAETTNPSGAVGLAAAATQAAATSAGTSCTDRVITELCSGAQRTAGAGVDGDVFLDYDIAAVVAGPHRRHRRRAQTVAAATSSGFGHDLDRRRC